MCEILNKISHIFSTTGQMHQAEKIKNRRKNEVVRPFEPRSGSTLVEQPYFFCGVI